jgi:hypothetical protein
VSRSNFSDNVGRCTPFLESFWATIFPYVVEFSFPFPKFIGWCADQYSREEKVIVNKQGFEAMCRVESLSIRYALSIPKSFSTMFEPFIEAKIIRVDRDYPSEVKDLFLQTIVKPEHLLESLSLTMTMSIMFIEVQWVCSLFSQILGLYNDKHVVEVMLGFLLKFV